MDLFIILTLAAASWISLTEGSIKCYCSLPECSETGYLCTSHLGKCFSQLGYEPGKALSRHGCMEMLQHKDRHVCEAQGDIIKSSNPGTGDNQSELPFLMCCKEQMCNYMDTIDVEILVNTSTNDTKDSVQSSSNPQARQEISQQDRWFKAAVIAVPIAGALILVLLVLLAVRMLRQDTRNHAQSLAKAQLYVDDHFYTDNMNPKYDGSLIHPQYSGAVHPQIYYPQHIVPHHHVVDCEYRDHGCYADCSHCQHRDCKGEPGGYEKIHDCHCTHSADGCSGSEVSSTVPSSCVVVASTHPQAGGPGTIV